MGPVDHQITAEAATGGCDVTVPKKSEVAPYVEDCMDGPWNSRVSSSTHNARHNTGDTSPDECTAEDARSKTSTQAGQHLHLLTEPTPTPPITSQDPSPGNLKRDPAANGRNPSHVSLAITIQDNQKESPVAPFTTLPATKCSQWTDFRANVIGAASFKLEEDGKAASMTIAPTKIDAQSASPAKTYEAWFHRILRGEQDVYKVDVVVENR